MLTLRKKLKSTLLIIITVSLLISNAMARSGRSSDNRSRGGSKVQQRTTGTRTTRQSTTRVSRSRPANVRSQSSSRTTAVSRRTINASPSTVRRTSSPPRTIGRKTPGRSQPVRRSAPQVRTQRSTTRSTSQVRTNVTRSVVKPQAISRTSSPRVTTVKRSVSTRTAPVTRSAPQVKTQTRNTVSTKSTTRTIRTTPKVTRNVFVSTNNHTRIVPLARTVSTSRSQSVKAKVQQNREKLQQRRTENQKRLREIQAANARKRQENQAAAAVRRQALQQKVQQNKERLQQRRTENQNRVKEKQTKTVTQSTRSSQADIIRQRQQENRERIQSNIERNRANIQQKQQEIRDNIAQRQAEIRQRQSENSINITRDINIERVNTPRGTKTVVNSSYQNERIINGKKFTTNINRTNVNHIPRGGHRPIITASGRRGSRHQDWGGNRDVKIVKHVNFHRQRHGSHPGRVFSRIVWPHYKQRIYYHWGSRRVCRYYRPYYHRKYVFVSFGGYWPSYRYVRYYNYGWHPYKWYGCYPTAYEVSSPSNTYYTYNNYYYSNGSDSAVATTASNSYWSSLPAVDHTTFEDVRDKLAEQAAKQPADETLVDKFFADGVEAFENEDYETAVKAFADAVALEPNDIVMPFAYVQALFATEQYTRAADILRLGLAAMPVDQQGLFFPRGLYNDDDILIDQIEKLRARAETFTYDLDMSLLLGYQYIGIEEYDKARQWLDHAAQYEYNKDASTILLNLLDLLQQQQASAAI